MQLDNFRASAEPQALFLSGSTYAHPRTQSTTRNTIAMRYPCTMHPTKKPARTLTHWLCMQLFVGHLPAAFAANREAAGLSANGFSLCSSFLSCTKLSLYYITGKGNILPHVLQNVVNCYPVKPFDVLDIVVQLAGNFAPRVVIEVAHTQDKA